MAQSTNGREKSVVRRKLVRRARVIVAGMLLLTVVCLPLIAGTRAYPLIIVNGNSMYPSLHNGDLVYYTSPQFGAIHNGSVIIFIQGNTGFSALDALLKPVLIHRVVGIETIGGKVYYKTQGDANDQADPFLTPQSNVLGVPQMVIPYAGMPVQYLLTPYGMVACIGLISLIYVSSVDTKFDEENERRKLVAVFAGLSLNGSITAAQFERLKLAIEYFEDVPQEMLRDPTMISLVDWLKDGNLRSKWESDRVPCPQCGNPSVRIVSGNKFFLICPACSDLRPNIS